MDGDAKSQANRWFVRLRAPDATEADRLAHADWLASDAEHEFAYAAVEQQWEDLGPLEAWARIELGQLNLASHARLRRRIAIGVGGFATAAALAVVAVWWAWSGNSPAGADIVRIATERAEQRQMALDDGSRLHLNTASEVDVRYTATLREIVVKTGESAFDVVHEEHRPFVVRAGQHSVVAVGTHFTIRRSEDGRWAVTVLEGRVAVVPGVPTGPDLVAAMLSSGSNASPWGGVILDADERLLIDGSGRIVAEEQTDAGIAAAWQSGMLKFRQTPLREVVKEMSRYTHDEVRVSSGVPDYPVTGIIHIRSSDTMVDYLVEVVPVTATKVGPDTIVLHEST